MYKQQQRNTIIGLFIVTSKNYNNNKKNQPNIIQLL